VMTAQFSRFVKHNNVTLNIYLPHVRLWLLPESGNLFILSLNITTWR